MFGKRPLGSIINAVFQKRHYKALLKMPQIYGSHFFSVLNSYLNHSGNYPINLDLRTPLGKIKPTLYSYHDILTVNEIFCREDYFADSKVKTVVDLGSNIGISALYFLTRNKDSKVFLFEPLPQNIERLKDNLVSFQDRYKLFELAVGVETKKVVFNFEESGRYGGIGLSNFVDSVEVDCVEINRILSDIIMECGYIDILKIDVEGLELDLLNKLSLEVSSKIKKIYLELTEGVELENQFPNMEDWKKSKYGPILIFERV